MNISVNGESKGDFFVELDDAGVLYIKTEDLVTLNLGYGPERTVLIHDERFVPVSALREVRASFDEKNLSLSVVGKTTEARKTEIIVFPLQSRPQDVYYPRETSAFLNYGLIYTYVSPLGSRTFTATNKLGVRSGDVFFVSDGLYINTETRDQFVRLQSSATYERRGDLQWLVLGDQFANSGDLGSSINMGGIGFSKVYRIDPYFITQPIFNLTGAAAFPSQADIYMDGVLLGRQQIAPGTFDLKNIYSYTGAHTVDIVLKDPFGNEQRASYPIYFSTQLLREGLHEYRYNLGFLREKYGLESADYGKSVFSVFHRYGVTNSLNIGARAEGSGGVKNGGVSLFFLVPRAGTFILSAAESSLHGNNGSAGSVQHSYQLGRFATNLLARSFSREYATVGAPPSPDMTRYETSIGVGLSLSSLGGISLSRSTGETYRGTATQVTSASYSRGLPKSTSLFATVSGSRTGGTTTHSFFIGLSFNFSKNLRGATQYNKTEGADTETVQIQKDMPVGEGLGYRAGINRARAAGSSVYSFNPSAQYNARYGTYSIDADIRHGSGRDSETYSVSAAGSIVYSGGFYGISRPVSDSFGVVMVGNVPNATVLNNGQKIGNTDASGFMVVPTLASYNLNQITVDTKNIPIDYSITSVTAARSPSMWSGTCIGFDAKKIQAVTGRLFAVRGAAKEPIEFAEGAVMVGTQHVTFLTGKGGEFYIENSLPREAKEGPDPRSCRSIIERRAGGGRAIKPGAYAASIDHQGKTCSFPISFPESGDVLTDLGEIVCGQSQDAAPPSAAAAPVAEALPAAPSFPAEEPVRSVSEEDPPSSIVVRLRIDGNGVRVTAKGRRAVSALVRFLARHPDSFVEIEGHADRHGPDEAGVRLGMRAANAMKDLLVRSGVKAGRIRKVESLGRKQMICTEETALCDALNRRVVVRTAAPLE